MYVFSNDGAKCSVPLHMLLQSFPMMLQNFRFKMCPIHRRISMRINRLQFLSQSKIFPHKHVVPNPSIAPSAQRTPCHKHPYPS